MAFKDIQIDELVLKSSSSELIFGMNEALASILIPTTVTIVVFLTGFFLNWLKSNYDKKRDIQSYRKLVLNWITKIEAGILEQSKSCISFSENFLEEKDIFIPKLRYTKLLVDRIVDVPLEKYISSFVINSKGLSNTNYDTTFKMIAHLDYVNNIEKQLKISYESLQKEVRLLVEEWNSGYFELYNLITNIDSLDIDRSDFRKKVGHIRDYWIMNCPNGRSNLNLSIELLVTPLTNLVKEKISDSSDKEFMLELYSNLQDLFIVQIKWNSLKEEFSYFFKDTGNNLRESLGALISAKEYFKNETRVNSIFFIS